MTVTKSRWREPSTACVCETVPAVLYTFRRLIRVARKARTIAKLIAPKAASSLGGSPSQDHSVSFASCASMSAIDAVSVSRAYCGSTEFMDGSGTTPAFSGGNRGTRRPDVHARQTRDCRYRNHLEMGRAPVLLGRVLQFHQASLSAANLYGSALFKRFFRHLPARSPTRRVTLSARETCPIAGIRHYTIK